MCQGDIAAKVAELAGKQSPILDPLVQRMRRSLDAGTPECALVDALSLLREAPASTALVEEGHASGAVLMKDHERYSEKPLRVRALLHSMRALLRPTPADRRAKHAERTLQRLGAMQPNRVHGRQMFFRQHVNTQLEGRRSPAERESESKLCMARHVKMFSALSPLERLPFEMEAARFVEQRKQDIGKAQAALQAEMCAIEREGAHARKTSGMPNHVLSARLSDVNLMSVCDVFDSPECQKLHLESHLWHFGPGPLPPSPSEQEVVRSAEKATARPDDSVEPPWWCRCICRLRDVFRGVAVGAEENGDFWLLLYAKKSPYQATFLQLRGRPVELDLAHDAGNDASWASLSRREYEFLPPTVRVETDVPFPGEEDHDIFVRTGLVFQGLVVVSPHSPLPLERFVAMHGSCSDKRPAAPSRPRRAPVAASKRDALMQEFPWLSDDDLPGAPPASPEAGAHIVSAPSDACARQRRR